MVINSTLSTAVQQSADGKMFALVNNKHIPWPDRETFLLETPKTRRHKGQVCYIGTDDNIEMYHFLGGIEDDNLVAFFGTIKGDIISPGGTILLPAGKLYREILLTGTGPVSVGLTDGGTEKLDTADISGDSPYVGYLNIKPLQTLTIYVKAQNNISYEIFRA